MLDGKPTLVLSYSEAYLNKVAEPVAIRLQPHGFRTVLVGEEPLPATVDSVPNDKVEWFFHRANMAVFLATPDDRLESGEVHTRQNIIDEHRLGQQLPHLKHRLMMFKATEVKLPSNINPVYERLPLDDPDWIVEKVVEQAEAWGVLSAKPAETEEREPQSSEEKTASPDLGTADGAVATQQANDALTQAADLLANRGGDSDGLERAQLAIAGLIAEGGGADTVGVHIANRLFAGRHDLRLRDSERVLLVRTYLRHIRDDNVPGARWLGELSQRKATDLLSSLVRDDSDSEIRGQALRILGKLRKPRDPSDARALVEALLRSDDFSLRWAALDFLRNRHDRKLRDLLDDPSLLEKDRHKASQTAALLDLPSRPGEVLSRYAEDAYVRDPAVEEGLLKASPRLAASKIEELLRSPVKDVRLFAARLAGTKGLRLAVAREVIDSDSSSRVRARVVKALVDSDGLADVRLLERATEKREGDDSELSDYDEIHALEVALYRRLPVSELGRHVKWISVRGPSSYEALGLNSEEWTRKHVRSDLRNDFKRLQTQARQGLLMDVTARAERSLKRSLTKGDLEAVHRVFETEWSRWAGEDNLGSFLLGRFRTAAMRVLSAWGRRSDIEFARRFSTSTNRELQAATLALFERFGTAHDASRLCEIAGQLYGQTHQRQAGQLAVELAFKKDKLEVLRSLRSVPSLRLWAVGRLSELDQEGVDEAWTLAKRDPDGGVRLAASEVVWGAIDPEHHDGLLSYYMKGKHFYNVVRAQDSRLYAPDWLRSALPVEESDENGD